jgi:hypothetical protein
LHRDKRGRKLEVLLLDLQGREIARPEDPAAQNSGEEDE